MTDIYIIIKEYDDKLAKRQPWYSISKLAQDLESKGLTYSIVSSDNLIPPQFTGIVIKVFSLADLWSRNKTLGSYYSLITFPIYSFNKFFKIPLKVIVNNWADLKRIFLFSLIPNYLLKKTFKKFDRLITISDRSYKYLENYTPLQYYPFIKNNWGGISKQSNKNNTFKKIGYFGPPFTTRCFDQVVDFFNWLDEQNTNFKKKIITRIERPELLEKEALYLSSFKDNPNNEVISGFLTREELGKNLLDIDVLILPFRIVMSELPIVVLEALELGIPIVTTEDSGIDKLTANNSNVLVLANLSQNNYDAVKVFIEKSGICDFSQIQNKIDTVNSNVLELICQK